MEQVLYDRFGKHGLGEHRNDDLPVIGAVHNAAGYLVSEMLGCGIRYNGDTAPDVLPANASHSRLTPKRSSMATRSSAFPACAMR